MRIVRQTILIKYLALFVIFEKKQQNLKLSSAANYRQTILMKYHALFVICEKAAKFEIVVCCKL